MPTKEQLWLVKLFIGCYTAEVVLYTQEVGS